MIFFYKITYFSNLVENFTLMQSIKVLVTKKYIKTLNLSVTKENHTVKLNCDICGDVS